MSAIVFMATACGSSATENAEAEEEVESAQVSSTESGEAESSEPAAEVIDRSGMRVITNPALGGVRLGIPTDVLTSSEGEMMTLRREGSGGVAIVARTSQAAGDETPIATVEDFVTAARAATGATVTVTDDSMTVFGTELSRHEFRDGTPPPGPGVFGSRSFGFSANAWWTPAPAADVYLGETEGGVLVFAATGPDEAAVADARSMIDELVPTLELMTDDGLPKPLPVFETSSFSRV